jgi:hypothetical protein
MATNPASPVRQPNGCTNNPKSNLIALVDRHSRAIIDAEVHRLARRAPSLSRDDLNAIDTVLQDLAEALILARLRNASQDTVPLLTRLFGTPGRGSRPKTEPYRHEAPRPEIRIDAMDDSRERFIDDQPPLGSANVLSRQSAGS